jgi:hypothetical protein
VYFTPRGNSPTGCSFIRLNKVDLGVDLYTGVEDKYGRVEGLTAGVDHEEIRDLRKEIGARFVEVRGVGLSYFTCTCWLTRNGPDRAALRVSVEPIFNYSVGKNFLLTSSLAARGLKLSGSTALLVSLSDPSTFWNQSSIVTMSLLVMILYTCTLSGSNNYRVPIRIWQLVFVILWL